MTENVERAPVLRVELISEDDEKTVARIALRGLNHKTINHLSTTSYEVVSGRGSMNVDGVEYELQEGVIVTVPAGTPYYDRGTVDMIATSRPPFDPSFVEVVG